MNPSGGAALMRNNHECVLILTIVLLKWDGLCIDNAGVISNSKSFKYVSYVTTYV
jgi:hypothetical protein